MSEETARAEEIAERWNAFFGRHHYGDDPFTVPCADVLVMLAERDRLLAIEDAANGLVEALSSQTYDSPALDALREALES